MFKSRILADLARLHGCKWVNYFCATDSVPASDRGESLDALVHEGRIEKDMIYLGQDKFDQPIHAPLYRLAPIDINFTDNPLSLVE